MEQAFFTPRIRKGPQRAAKGRKVGKNMLPDFFCDQAFFSFPCSASMPSSQGENPPRGGAGVSVPPKHPPRPPSKGEFSRSHALRGNGIFLVPMLCVGTAFPDAPRPVWPQTRCVGISFRHRPKFRQRSVSAFPFPCSANSSKTKYASAAPISTSPGRRRVCQSPEFDFRNGYGMNSKSEQQEACMKQRAESKRRILISDISHVEYKPLIL